ncbi:hypothetical protein B0H10DRAFT_148494 [Mycena sp. CBHHK59/15]|nr:hypothetical protein B0H10DRAFT_148494 [Mycena sp. CBHHK59/15]
MASSASEVTIYAQLLKLTEMQALLTPAAAAFTIPKKLDNKIDVHSIRTLLSPTLCHYVKKAGGDTPSGIMKSLVQEHASPWGLTVDVLDDKIQWGVVTTRIRTRLTDRRYKIKKVLCDAMWVSVKGEDGQVTITDLEEPCDIIKLCEALVAIVPDANVKVTLPMLGRVALLRQILVDVNSGAKFWEKVDEQLAKLRTKYENDEQLISKYVHYVKNYVCGTRRRTRRSSCSSPTAWANVRARRGGRGLWSKRRRRRRTTGAAGGRTAMPSRGWARSQRGTCTTRARRSARGRPRARGTRVGGAKRRGWH